MTDYPFRSGIMVHLPDDWGEVSKNALEQWTNVKMAMDIIIGSPSKEPVNLYKILEPGWPSLKQPKTTKRKSYHRIKKQ